MSQYALGRFLSIISNLRGWKTNRKIIVIESDDWGSIRMPSREVYDACLRAGYPVDKIAYEKYDTLLSKNDLELLFDLLLSFKDHTGKSPIITANCVVANPNFRKIRLRDFQEYHYELITDTFKRYPDHSTNFKLWNKAIETKIFLPQYHAREHLNVSLFMNALRRKDNDALFGFNNEMPGCMAMGSPLKGNVYVEALNYNDTQDKENKLKIYLNGLDIFYELFGYRSVSIIPPNYLWSLDFNEAVHKKEVKIFQGIRRITEPVPNGKKQYHPVYLGKLNRLGQVYLKRNALFEPSLFRLGINDPVGKCLSDISTSFMMKKPAIICSHRINYAGFLDSNNRDNTLKLLKHLLTTVIKRWPNVEFMSSPELGQLILSQR